MRMIVLKFLLKLILRFHSFTYQYAGSLAIKVDGIHPKHRLIKYKEWFLDQINTEDVVLDIGSNTGALPRLLGQKASKLYGIEILASLHNIALQQNCGNNIEFINADATDYNYDQLEPITVITLSNVLEHISERVKFLKEINNKVNWKNNNQKKYLIRVPMRDRDWITLYKKELGLEWRLDLTHYTEYTVDEITKEMHKSGLTIHAMSICYGEAYIVAYAK